MLRPIIGVLGYVLHPERDRVLMVLRSRDGDQHQGKYNGLGGKLEAHEDVVGCLHRELMEEAGYGARDLQVLRSITLAPVYMSHQTHLVLARDLYPQRLPGDEPEALEVVPWKLAELGQLILREEFSEGRSIAALFLVRERLEQKPHG